ncbi:MAG: hypothetical protein ACI9IP_001159 [Arcticibacterium sp.]|jgi:hypothetical protein
MLTFFVSLDGIIIEVNSHNRKKRNMRLLIKILLMVFLCFTGMAQSSVTKPKAQQNNLQIVTAANLKLVSKEVVDANCETITGDEINVINTVVRGSTGGCLEITATEFIDINEFFDSENGSTFDARIGAVDTPPDPVPPPSEVKQCEDFSNHGPTNPHLYAQKYNNSFVGDLISKYTPEYKIEGLTDWKLMSTAGAFQPGSDLNYHFYSEPSDGEGRYTVLRTKAGCSEFRDIRSQRVYDNTLEDWIDLPNSLPSINPVAKDFYIMVNSELEGRSNFEEIPVYNLFADRVINNLTARINGHDYVGFDLFTYPIFKVRQNNNMMDTRAIYVQKDFVMDVSDDSFNTAARYNVHRNYQGGHWSTVTTLTRHDGQVTVSVQGIAWDMNQILMNTSTGQSYNNINQFGNVFDLGFLPDGNYNFAIKTYHGVTINNNIRVNVKRPATN